MLSTTKCTLSTYPVAIDLANLKRRDVKFTDGNLPILKTQLINKFALA